MEGLKLNYYRYSKELRQFNRLDVGGSYVNFIKELAIITEYLTDNLIQFEVDEKLNILLLKSINEIDIIPLNKQSNS